MNRHQFIVAAAGGAALIGPAVVGTAGNETSAAILESDIRRHYAELQKILAALRTAPEHERLALCGAALAVLQCRAVNGVERTLSCIDTELEPKAGTPLHPYYRQMVTGVRAMRNICLDVPLYDEAVAHTDKRDFAFFLDLAERGRAAAFDDVANGPVALAAKREAARRSGK